MGPVIAVQCSCPILTHPLESSPDRRSSARAQDCWDLSVPLNRKRTRSLTHPQGMHSTAGPNRSRDSKGRVRVGLQKLAGNCRELQGIAGNHRESQGMPAAA